MNIEQFERAMETDDVLAAMLFAGTLPDINHAHTEFDGGTLLCRAVECHATEVTRALLARGADADTPNRHGYTPLHFAASTGRDDMVLDLLHAGADPNKKDKTEYLSPFHYAVYNDHLACVNNLIQAGADVVSLLEDGRSSIHLASRLPNADILSRLLIAGANIHVNTLDGRGYAPLHLAYSVDAIRLLVSSGSDVNLKNYLGRTALHLLVDIGDVLGLKEALQVLLTLGVDLGVRDNYGETALDIAKRKGHRNVIGLLTQ